MSRIVTLPGFSDEVLKNLDSMRRQSILTDVTLTCGGKSFYAHRSHLSATSQYLFDMFNSGLKESTENTVDFPSIKPKSLQIILDILYSGQLIPVDLCNLPDLIVALHMMQLDKVFAHYREVFIASISKDNFKTYWEIGENLKDDVILNAVYSIIENVYQLPDFKTIDKFRLEKLLQYLFMKCMSHDLILKVILQASLFKENSQESFDEMLTFIDFQKISNEFLASIDKNPLVKNSTIFHSKCHAVTLQRFQFVTSFSQHLTSLPLLYLFGQDIDLQGVIQRCLLGEWENVVLEDTIIPDHAVVVIQKSSFKFLIIKDIVGPLQLKCIEFDTQGHKLREEILKDESVNELLIEREVRHRLLSAGFTMEKMNKNSDTESMDSHSEDSHSEELSQLRKCHLLICDEDLFSIDQTEKEEGKMMLEIYESRNRLPAGPWNIRLAIDWTNMTTNWFAYFFPPDFIVIRCFPGPSLYFNIHSNGSAIYEFKEDNNILENVVALVVNEWNVCCLTSEGSVFFQDIRESTSEWKFLIKCPFPLCKYYQIILNNY